MVVTISVRAINNQNDLATIDRNCEEWRTIVFAFVYADDMRSSLKHVVDVHSEKLVEEFFDRKKLR